ncbi:MAG: hypothetical protein Q8878_01675 [Bacillota bacterium]|nr:hypothetical protein [Bacillota bacterium]
MKKGVSLAASLIICVSILAPCAKAADSGKTVVSLDTIEKIMVSSSEDLKKLNADLKDAESDYSDFYKIVESLKKANAESPSATLTSSYNANKANRDNYYIVYLNQKMQYDKNVQQLVLKAKQLYFAYNTDLTQEQCKLKQLEYEKQEFAAADAKLKAGYLSQNEFDSISLELATYSDSYASQQQKTKSDLQSLITGLGLKTEDTGVEVAAPAIDEAAFSTIPSISFSDDNTAMLANNVSVKALEAALEVRKEATIKDYSKMDTLTVSIEQAKNNAVLSFQQQYNALSDAYNAYKTALSAYKVKNTAYENAKLKYQYGYISILQLNGLELSKIQSDIALSSQRENLYLAFLRYNQMKSGS